MSINISWTPISVKAERALNKISFSKFEEIVRKNIEILEGMGEKPPGR